MSDSPTPDLSLREKAATTPLRVRVTRSVSSDPSMFLETQTTIGPGEYKATINAHGAVAVLLHDGGRLGVKPHEFEFIAENVVALLSRVERAEAAITAYVAAHEAALAGVARVEDGPRAAAYWLAFDGIYCIVNPSHALTTPEAPNAL